MWTQTIIGLFSSHHMYTQWGMIRCYLNIEEGNPPLVLYLFFKTGDMSDFHFYHFFLRLWEICKSCFRLLGKVKWCIFVQLSYHTVGHLRVNLWCCLLRLLWVPIWQFAKLARFFGNKSLFMPFVAISKLLMSAFCNDKKKGCVETTADVSIL